MEEVAEDYAAFIARYFPFAVFSTSPSLAIFASSIASCSLALFLLQLHQNSPDAASYSRDGGWCD
jgi:hypothetical protein